MVSHYHLINLEYLQPEHRRGLHGDMDAKNNNRYVVVFLLLIIFILEILCMTRHIYNKLACQRVIIRQLTIVWGVASIYQLVLRAKKK